MTALIGSLLFIGGCSTFDSTWKKHQPYGEYINPPPRRIMMTKGY